MDIVLASTSKYRRELITRILPHARTMAPVFDEDTAKRALMNMPSEELSAALARGKARSLMRVCPRALIIGCDQIAEFESERLEKPATENAAIRQLTALSGKEHKLFSAVCVVDAASGRTAEAVDVHRMSMRDWDEKAIRAYVRRDQPMDCAGSYRVESLGIALFERMEGEDFSGIIGLPLTKLIGLLLQFGVNIF